MLVECFAQEHKKLSQSGLELLWKLAPLVQYGQFRFVSLLMQFSEAICRNRTRPRALIIT